MNKLLIILIIIGLLFGSFEFSLAQDEEDIVDVLKDVWKKFVECWKKVHQWIKDNWKGKVPENIRDWWEKEKQLLKQEWEKELEEMKKDFKSIFSGGDFWQKLKDSIGL